MSKRLKLSQRHINRLANEDARLQAESIKIHKEFMDALSENSFPTEVEVTETEDKNSDNSSHNRSVENHSLSPIQEEEKFSLGILPSDLPSDENVRK